MKPAVSGKPVSPSISSVKTAATSGDFLARPAHFDRSVASPFGSRTIATMPNAATVTKPYSIR